MIIFRYLSQEVQRAFFAILGVLFLIFFSQRIVIYLGEAGDGEIGLWSVLKLLLFYLPVLASLLLPLTLFLGILLALGRMYVENEMTVLRSSGVGEQQIARQLLRPVLQLSVAGLVLTTVVMPWAAEEQARVYDAEAARAELNLLSPGRFQSIGEVGGVIYVREQAGEEGVGGIFLANVPHRSTISATENLTDTTGKTSVLSARSGTHWQDEKDGTRYLILENGFRYEFSPGHSDWSVTQFDKYFLRLAVKDGSPDRRRLRAIPTWNLFDRSNLAYLAELQWRLSLPVSMPILALLAIPLCRVKPREGKFAKILPGLFIYLIYTGTLMYLRSAMELGNWPIWIGLWLPHLMVLALALWLLRRDEKGTM